MVITKDVAITWLLVSSIVFIGIAVLAYFKSVEKLDLAMVESRKKRAFCFLLSIVIPMVVAVASDVADFSKLIDGKGGRRDLALILGCVFCSTLYLYLQAILWFHDDKWDLRMSEANSEKEKAIQQANEEKEKAIQRAKDRETLNRFWLTVNESFLNVVAGKAKRVRTAVATSGSDTEPISLEDVLSPGEQILAITHVAYHLFKEDFPKGKRLRIAYFEENADEVLEPVYSWDGTENDCVEGPNKGGSEKFHINDGMTECLAVYAARSGKIYAVEDALASSNDTDFPFNFFYSQQQENVKSLLVIPLGKSERPYRVLCLDCNIQGHFDDSVLWKAEHIKENVERRLIFECDMQKLLHISGLKVQSDDRN